MSNRIPPKIVAFPSQPSMPLAETVNWPALAFAHDRNEPITARRPPATAIEPTAVVPDERGRITSISLVVGSRVTSQYRAHAARRGWAVRERRAGTSGRERP